jgi:hypothetical protein
MDYDHGTNLQSRNEVSQNFDAILVRPIVKDPAQIIDVCRDRLRCKEVAAKQLLPTLWDAVTVSSTEHYLLGHKINLLTQVTWKLHLALLDHVRQVLYDASHFREAPCNSYRNTTVRSAEIHDDTIIWPRDVGKKQIRVKVLFPGGIGHDLCKPVAFLGVRLKVVPHARIGVVS